MQLNTPLGTVELSYLKYVILKSFNVCYKFILQYIIIDQPLDSEPHWHHEKVFFDYQMLQSIKLLLDHYCIVIMEFIRGFGLDNWIDVKIGLSRIFVTK